MFIPPFKGNTEFEVLYFSDVHAKVHNIRHFKSAVDEFDSKNKDKNTLKLAGGDINMDTAVKPNTLILKLMDLIGLDASSVGNHDLEGGNYWLEAIEKAKPKFKFLAANLNFTRANKLQNKIAKSTIIDRKGQKTGIIGVSPLDYGNLTFIAPFNDFVKVMSLQKTLQEVRKEVKKLEKQGINKIFLLAHTGKTSSDGTELYEQLAKIGGVDVIIGGHDHREYDNWYLSERKEPVKVVSVGKAQDKDIIGEDLDSFGILKAVFDENGILLPSEFQNQVELTQNYPVSQDVLDLEEEYLQTSKVVSYSNMDLSCKNRMTEENPIGSLAADAMLWLVNKETKGDKAQIAFVNSGTIRSSISKGNITNGDIRQALPFTSSTLIKAKLTKKQIIKTLNWGAESTTLPKIAPGIMQVGGLRYTIGEDNIVKDVYIVNQDGTLGEKLDNQPDDKEYTVAYDLFLMTGVAGLSELKKNPEKDDVEYFPYSRQDTLIEYLRSNFLNKPVDVKLGRIEIEKQKASIVV